MPLENKIQNSATALCKAFCQIHRPSRVLPLFLSFHSSHDTLSPPSPLAGSKNPSLFRHCLVVTLARSVHTVSCKRVTMERRKSLLSPGQPILRFIFFVASFRSIDTPDIRQIIFPDKPNNQIETVIRGKKDPTTSLRRKLQEAKSICTYIRDRHFPEIAFSPPELVEQRRRLSIRLPAWLRLYVSLFHRSYSSSFLLLHQPLVDLEHTRATDEHTRVSSLHRYASATDSNCKSNRTCPAERSPGIFVPVARSSFPRIFREKKAG